MAKEDLIWIQEQQLCMQKQLQKWADINSFSRNPQGLNKIASLLEEDFKKLNPDKTEKMACGDAHCLFFEKRKKNGLHLFLAGHMDTVFAPSSLFQKTTFPNKEQMMGPGVCDMKGGLVILYTLLQAIERSDLADQIGWSLLINPDEEIGSLQSTPFFKQVAPGADLALVFEPSLPDGSLICSRPASANYHAKVVGKAAHVGRHAKEGKNAIFALANFLHAIEPLNTDDSIVNVGTINGGKTANIVADYAEAYINVRGTDEKAFHQIEALAKKKHVELKRESFRPAKPFDQKTKELFLTLQRCAKKMSTTIRWQPSGGVCDGNLIASLNIPTIDTLGAIGGGIHTEQEFVSLASLSERCSLAFLFLEELATQKVPI